MTDPFQQAEREFLRLKVKLAVGRMSSEEFNAALEQLTVRDAQGRVWKINPETGNWQVRDAAGPSTPPERPHVFFRTPRRSHRKRNLILGTSIVVVLILAGAASLAVFSARPPAQMGVNLAATPTLASVSIAAAVPTGTPLPTLTPTEAPTQTPLPPTPTDTPTPSPVPTATDTPSPTPTPTPAPLMLNGKFTIKWAQDFETTGTMYLIVNVSTRRAAAYVEGVGTYSVGDASCPPEDVKTLTTVRKFSGTLAGTVDPITGELALSYDPQHSSMQGTASTSGGCGEPATTNAPPGLALDGVFDLKNHTAQGRIYSALSFDPGEGNWSTGE